jgi:hypothetical protein
MKTGDTITIKGKEHTIISVWSNLITAKNGEGLLKSYSPSDIPSIPKLDEIVLYKGNLCKVTWVSFFNISMQKLDNIMYNERYVSAPIEDIKKLDVEFVFYPIGKTAFRTVTAYHHDGKYYDGNGKEVTVYKAQTPKPITEIVKLCTQEFQPDL